MKEINKIIGGNISCLRKKNNLTQVGLAEKLNYSDKAISKWETGEALPDIQTLYNVAQLFGVSLNDLTTENATQDIKIENAEKSNKIIITCLSISIIWIISTIVFVYGQIQSHEIYWTMFVWSVPASAILLEIFNSIWGKRQYTFIIVSILNWTLLASFYLELLNKNLWPIFLIGIPIQIAIILWSQLKKRKD